MQVSVETTSGLERQMTITVPAERIDQDVDKLVAQQARTRRLDGFRPGKVPPKVIKRMFGSAIRQDVLGQVVQETFYSAVEQEKLQPAGGERRIWLYPSGKPCSGKNPGNGFERRCL